MRALQAPGSLRLPNGEPSGSGAGIRLRSARRPPPLTSTCAAARRRAERSIDGAVPVRRRGCRRASGAADRVAAEDVEAAQAGPIRHPDEDPVAAEEEVEAQARGRRRSHALRLNERCRGEPEVSPWRSGSRVGGNSGSRADAGSAYASTRLCRKGRHGKQVPTKAKCHQRRSTRMLPQKRAWSRAAHRALRRRWARGSRAIMTAPGAAARRTASKRRAL